jgi:predicted MFS family arabinose efflux permease
VFVAIRIFVGRHAVPTRNSKTIFFVFEWGNALATTYFGNYIYFLLRDRFDFGNAGNLSAAALAGFAYMLASRQGGRFAQRFGCLAALKIGFFGMAACLTFGGCFSSLTAVLLTLVGWTTAVCFTWPALEALVSDGVGDNALQRNVGIYNVVWAAATATMYFFGGTLYEMLGSNSVFWLPAIIHAGVGLAVLRLDKNSFAALTAPSTAASPHSLEVAAFAPSASPRTFLRMAWLAIPFSYIGITTIVAGIPALAKTLGLSTAQAGLFCSIWMFARLVAFVVLWQWTGWHYRFRWLLCSFVGMTVSFSLLLLSHNLWLLVAVQVVFGVSVGLIYYASLFYSMDVGETKGEHGGFHESMIGLGNCLGPAMGALSLCLAPHFPNAGVYSIITLLTCGLVGLISIHLQQAE